METQTERTRKRKVEAGTECPARDGSWLFSSATNKDGPCPTTFCEALFHLNSPEAQLMSCSTCKDSSVLQKEHACPPGLKSWALLSSAGLTTGHSVLQRVSVHALRAGFPRIHSLWVWCPYQSSLTPQLQGDISTSCCGHSDMLSSRETNAPGKLFGLYSDFQEGNECGPMGLPRFYKQKGLDFPSKLCLSLAG